jgi:outer membrane receptor protein involved in Fe transport
MKRLLLITSLLFSFHTFFAQTNPVNGIINGVVVDVKNKGVELATVTLMKKDSTVGGGSMTKEDGGFVIEHLAEGSYLLRINVLGFKERFIDHIEITKTALEKKLGKITISSSSQALKEVEIVGEKNMVELSADKKVFNVEKNITAVGGSATDVLKNIPTLSVDVDGDILLRGKETTLLIDGKPATLLGGEVADALQSLPASVIQSVEIITNPTANYDAQGMAGIINIITKKDKKFGRNGTFTVGAGTHDKYNASLNLNMRNDRWNIFFNTGYRYNTNYQHIANERKTLEGILSSGSYENSTRINDAFFNTLGTEYTYSKRTSFILTANLNRMHWGNSAITDYNYFNEGKIDSTQRRYTYFYGGPLSASTSLDYKHKFEKEKRELTANITFARNNMHRDQEYKTWMLDSAGKQKGNEVIQTLPGNGGNTSLNSQADFTTPFLTSNGMLSAGWKSQLFWFETSNNAQVDYGNGNGFVKDSLLQNDYRYLQQTQAAYTRFSDQHGKFGYQLGLRLEYSRYDGTSSLLKGNSYSNEFLNLFPSAYASYKLAKNQMLYASYTRRINRPSFFQMMPYKDVGNPMDTLAGNPNLIPEFIHNVELNYNKQFEQGHTLIASAYYQFTQNLVDKIKRFSADSSGKSLTMSQNLNHGITYGLELTGKFQLKPNWDATINFNYFNNIISGAIGTTSLNNNGSSWFSKMNSNIKLPKNYSIQITSGYEAPKIASQGTLKEVYWLDIAVRKNLLKNKVTAVVNFTDIFNSRKSTNLYEFSSALQTVYRDKETRILNFTLSYRFGKSDSKNNNNKKTKDSSSMPENDRNNIKSDDGE